MRKFLLLTCSLFIDIWSSATAQTFTLQADTVNAVVNGSNISVPDHITCRTADSIKIRWQVAATDFPSDWTISTALNICDNKSCYFNDGSIWPRDTTLTSDWYYKNVKSDFHLLLDLSSATHTGTHYMFIKMYEPISGYTDTAHFFVTRWPNGVTTATRSEDDIVLYPNPAHSQLNVVFNSASNIKTISVYNLIGRVMNVYKVSGNNAGMDISNLPSGVYFLRLADAQGNVVATRKFTHQ